MNILDIATHNSFIKKLYPTGLSCFSVRSLALSQDRVTLVLHEETAPAIQVEKWGVWGKDYSIITFEFIGLPLHKATIDNWQNNREDVEFISTILVQDDLLHIQFKGVDWEVEVVLSSLVFQRNSTYLKG
ncbi:MULTISPECIES: hypothetical protein [unclassified Myroides]|uniref:hypothetical protein n=1 Tax=unclassified Myroides TaxID=2642485 RepID=UPI003D2F68B3